MAFFILKDSPNERIGADYEVLGNVAIRRCVWDATTDPSPTNDEANTLSGYPEWGWQVGSLWYNATGKRLWICADATEGAAVWLRMLTSGDEPFVDVPYASTITFDASIWHNYKTTLTGNAIFAISNTSKASGRALTINIVQDATGGHVATWQAAFKFAGGAGNAVLSTAPNAQDTVSGYIRGTQLYNCALAKGHS